MSRISSSSARSIDRRAGSTVSSRLLAAHTQRSFLRDAPSARSSSAASWRSSCVLDSDSTTCARSKRVELDELAAFDTVSVGDNCGSVRLQKYNSSFANRVRGGIVPAFSTQEPVIACAGNGVMTVSKASNPTEQICSIPLVGGRVTCTTHGIAMTSNNGEEVILCIHNVLKRSAFEKFLRLRCFGAVTPSSPPEVRPPQASAVVGHLTRNTLDSSPLGGIDESPVAQPPKQQDEARAARREVLYAQLRSLKKKRDLIES